MTANSKPQLLIVDDEPAILLSYRIILERKGYDVASAADSPSAHELLNQRQFDMLLCDLGLEQPLSGMKIVRWARQNRPQMACILLSGYPDEQITEEADRTGVHTLCKPVEVPALLETIQCVLQSNSKS
jgi:DNA-binding NtrC family response regulator